MSRLCLLVLLPALVLSDMYLQNPRGSNNRLNERSANRRNGNRLFDSQNNNRGGYNAGDQGASAFRKEDEQYRMKYFQSHEDYKTLGDDKGKTVLTLEWTNQHGCGGDEDSDPHKVNCNIVFQYMCHDDDGTATGEKPEYDFLRNGRVTGTQRYSAPAKSAVGTEKLKPYIRRRKRSTNINFGLHERFQYYDNCYVRERNEGLFRADQDKGTSKLGYSPATHTRQNDNGNRNGLECPEERDYYPYWHPNPWKDIAVLAVDQKDCSNYRKQSSNVQPYNLCVEKFDEGIMRPHSRWNNEKDCKANGGTWTLFHNYLEISDIDNKADCDQANGGPHKYIWGIPHDSLDGVTQYCMVALDEPHCKQAPWSRTNHLGNGKEGVPLRYNWVLPHFPSGNTKRCVLRARYNISTDDYNPKTTDHNDNDNNSPVKENPLFQTGKEELQLAINTAQFGRTFQDRSHVFFLEPRTPDIGEARLYNLNVRGKRGNIVQTFPAVEYDFIPNDLELKVGDMLHIQWTGSNSHRNGNPGGDGQTGDAGQGTSGTDRHNFVQTKSAGVNYPLPIDKTSFWGAVKTVWIHHDRTDLAPIDLAIGLATSGYYECYDENSCKDNPNTKNMNVDLNNVPASYPGAVLEMVKPGTYYYMCSRNNAFTNRSQKGKITVK